MINVATMLGTYLPSVALFINGGSYMNIDHYHLSYAYYLMPSMWHYYNKDL